ncbi:MAG: translation elongation factor Ts [gamma proteobacterium symbiont of Lucinoma myriamae]|nr:translation elongation factor Ts [gamma proteobacterium symbiont of Lucinoma myriamae]MCU7818943.1 translation elongation factor Ts [gamma proteobacterium symbiont of Lucinoma myriamae]MCU7831974.1 translation elongation factor Ts [gamma proteobacterium symbiont of Lucinoma myriamae]
MAITASLVKELRDRTGAGMMECKKSLVETDGDIEAAIELMRKTGLAKADKKAGRIAAEGKVVVEFSDDAKKGVMLEVNCETDFVAMGDEFGNFASAVAKRILADAPADVEALLAMPLEEGPEDINTVLKTMIAKIGENMSVRRFVTFETEGQLGAYLHGTKIGVVVDMQDGNAELIKDVAMHVAASNPKGLDESSLDQAELAKEKEIAAAEAANSGKPENIIEKIVEGKIRRFIKDNTLMGQAFVKDPDITVEKLVKNADATVLGFTRLEVGEGMEKKSEDFAAEVMAQIGA